MKSSADRSTYSIRISKFACSSFALVTTLLIALSGICAGEETSVVTTGDPAPENQQAEAFEYIIEDRKDPFVPFITTRATTTSEVDMNEIVEKEVELTGMQLFEPGQLSLVALLKSGEQDFAMVEDFTGKGYIISEGTKIGRRGVVLDIVPNKVIIEETAETRAGRKIVTKTVMVLKKEGEE